MEALIKALGQIPKWFTSIALAFILVLLAVATYSVTRTIIYDCGTVEVAGTISLGDHCSNVTTSNWSLIKAAPPAQGSAPQEPGAALRECRAKAWNAASALEGLKSSGESILPEGSSVDAAINETDSSQLASVAVIWHKLQRGRYHFDLLYQCSRDHVVTVVSGPDVKDHSTVDLLISAEAAFIGASDKN